MKTLGIIFLSYFGLVIGGFAQLIMDPGFATTTDMTVTTGAPVAASGDWSLVLLGGSSATATFTPPPGEATITGAAYLTPLSSPPSGGSPFGTPVALTMGETYILTFDDDTSANMEAGQLEIYEGGGVGDPGSAIAVATTPGFNSIVFTANTNGPLEFVNLDPLGTGTAISFDDPTLTPVPEPSSVIFCTVLGFGICWVERKRLVKLLLPQYLGKFAGRLSPN